MPDIQLYITKADMQLMEKHANQILKLRNLDPDIVRYEQNLKIVTENMGLILKDKGEKQDESIHL